MTNEQIIQLWSALSGLAGTLILFLGSYSFQPMEGASWGGPMTNANNAKIRARNLIRKWVQRIGLGLLMVSFAIQIGAVFVSSRADETPPPPVPACSNGAEECPPWEREWTDEKLAIGSVVTTDGRIVSAPAEIAD